MGQHRVSAKLVLLFGALLTLAGCAAQPMDRIAVLKGISDVRFEPICDRIYSEDLDRLYADPPQRWFGPSSNQRYISQYGLPEGDLFIERSRQGRAVGAFHFPRESRLESCAKDEAFIKAVEIVLFMEIAQLDYYSSSYQRILRREQVCGTSAMASLCNVFSMRTGIFPAYECTITYYRMFPIEPFQVNIHDALRRGPWRVEFGRLRPKPGQSCADFHNDRTIG